jgi:DNA-binding winged helix-turn-helix (wHTH) protein/tetratricopeptide (TPR) repeat protein
LSLRYRSGEFIIHPKHHLIESDGQQTQVRSKVFMLMLLLLEHRDEVLSKEFLLATIWDDVEVDEQVLFQSIREIRILFSDYIVIKTHPRKGYRWIADIEVLPEIKATSISETTRPNKKLTLAWFITAIIVVVLIFSLAYWFIAHSKQNQFKGSVVVLPMKSSIVDGDHGWLYLGAMDQVISQLASDQNVAVMPTDYVLEIMKRAALPRDYTNEQIKRVFEVSGAKIVVESEFSGAVQEYRLAYKFYFEDHVKRGVIFSNSTASALTELAQKITTYTGQPLKALQQHANLDFNNELLARALDLSNQNNFAGASQLLSSLTALEPSNMLAHRLLAQTYILQQQFDLAEQIILTAIEKPVANNSPELARLYFNLASIQALRGNFTLAQSTFMKVDVLAQKNNDWLFRAYTAQQMSAIQQRLKNYQSAQSFLDLALSYHKVIQCPVGQSQTWLQMAKLSLDQGNTLQANQYLTQAEQLINQRQLEGLAMETSEFRGKLNKIQILDNI